VRSGRSSPAGCGVDGAEPVPLADVAAAHRRIESGRSTGKLVLAVKP
jgi:hypothetical protein